MTIKASYMRLEVLVPIQITLNLHRRVRCKYPPIHFGSQNLRKSPWSRVICEGGGVIIFAELYAKILRIAHLSDPNLRWTSEVRQATVDGVLSFVVAQLHILAWETLYVCHGFLPRVKSRRM